MCKVPAVRVLLTAWCCVFTVVTLFAVAELAPFCWFVQNHHVLMDLSLKTILERLALKTNGTKNRPVKLITRSSCVHRTALVVGSVQSGPKRVITTTGRRPVSPRLCRFSQRRATWYECIFSLTSCWYESYGEYQTEKRFGRQIQTEDLGRYGDEFAPPAFVQKIFLLITSQSNTKYEVLSRQPAMKWPDLCSKAWKLHFNFCLVRH